MTDQSWKPLFRTPHSSVSRVLHSPAFRHARERSGTIIERPGELRGLADLVEALDYADAPLSAVAAQVAAAVRFLRATADLLEVGAPPGGPNAGAGERDAPGLHAGASAARQRLVVAALDYLVTREDLVPDFRAGGYVDDVLAMTWVFGAAEQELAPHMADDPA